VARLLFTVGKFLIGLYIGKSGVASGFGAAGSLVIVFIWVYYSAQIFLVGAEFTWVYAKTLGSLRGSEGIAEVVDKAANADQAPSRSDSPNEDGDASGARDAGAARPAALADVGAGIAMFFAIRFLLPRLLRRL